MPWNPLTPEEQRVIDVVLQGHQQMWDCMREKDAIYANPEASEEDYLHAAELEGRFAEYDGYTAEARAGELLGGPVMAAPRRVAVVLFNLGGPDSLAAVQPFLSGAISKTVMS